MGNPTFQVETTSILFAKYRYIFIYIFLHFYSDDWLWSEE